MLGLIAAPAPARAAAPESIAEVRVRTVDTARGEVGYRSFGKGPPLVMIMGLSGTIDGWPPSFADALARERRVITFDNAGIGRSSLGTAPLTVAGMADNTAALVRALRLKRADVLGWSLGGMIAQSLVSRHPRLVRRLVLCATAPGDGGATLPDLTALGQLGDTTGTGGLGLLFPPGRDSLAAAYARDISKYPQLNPIAPAEVTGQQLRAAGVWLTGGDPSGREPGRLGLPVLIGAGALDRALPVANQRHLARVLPNARLKVYADAAHGFFIQRRRDFVRRVERFLATRRGR